MNIFSPIKRQFVPRRKVDVTLTMLERAHDQTSPKADTEVIEMHGDDAWQEWQDSVFVVEFTDEAMNTVPGKLG